MEAVARAFWEVIFALVLFLFVYITPTAAHAVGADEKGNR